MRGYAGLPERESLTITYFTALAQRPPILLCRSPMAGP
jgi:hypothetical protein